MAPTKKREALPEILNREGRVSEWQAFVFAHGGDLDEESPLHRSRPVLHLRGEFDEAISGIARFQFILTIGPSALTQSRTPYVGALLQVKPEIQARITLSRDEFQTVLALATSGTLNTVSCGFQPLRQGTGLVMHAEFLGGGLIRA